MARMTPGPAGWISCMAVNMGNMGGSVFPHLPLKRGQSNSVWQYLVHFHWLDFLWLYSCSITFYEWKPCDMGRGVRKHKSIKAKRLIKYLTVGERCFVAKKWRTKQGCSVPKHIYIHKTHLVKWTVLETSFVCCDFVVILCSKYFMSKMTWQGGLWNVGEGWAAH